MVIWATVLIIAAAWGTMAGWTIYASVDVYENNTISNVTTALMLWAPALAAALGSVSGHWTWPAEAPALGLSEHGAMWLQFWLIWVAVLLTPLLRKVPLPVTFAAYYVSAHYLWPQDIDQQVARNILPFW